MSSRRAKPICRNPGCKKKVLVPPKQFCSLRCEEQAAEAVIALTRTTELEPEYKRALAAVDRMAKTRSRDE